MIGPDNQDRVLDSLTSYINAERNKVGKTLLPVKEIKVLLEQAAQQAQPPEQRNGPITIQSVVEGCENLLPVLQELQLEDSSISKEAGRLMETLEQAYYLPLFKTYLYKPAALFWAMYHENNQDSKLAPQAMLDFLQGFMEEKAQDTAGTDENSVVLNY